MRFVTVVQSRRLSAIARTRWDRPGLARRLQRTYGAVEHVGFLFASVRCVAADS